MKDISYVPQIVLSL